MALRCVIRVARTEVGYRVCVDGRGTFRDSPALVQFVKTALGEAEGGVAIDFANCDYVDSTFLGMLVDFRKRFGRGAGSRFSIVAPSEISRKLFATNRLERVLEPVTDGPEAVGADVELPPESLDEVDLGRHIMECHRRLAELGGPNHAAFARVADQLASELANR